MHSDFMTQRHLECECEISKAADRTPSEASQVTKVKPLLHDSMITSIVNGLNMFNECPQDLAISLSIFQHLSSREPTSCNAAASCSSSFSRLASLRLSLGPPANSTVPGATGGPGVEFMARKARKWIEWTEVAKVKAKILHIAAHFLAER